MVETIAAAAVIVGSIATLAAATITEGLRARRIEREVTR